MSRSIFLSVVMPAYNEESNIESVLEEHIAVLFMLPSIVTEWELLCLDDSSTDSTAEIIETIAHRVDRLRLIRHKTNQGIYQSFSDLYHEARGTHVYATGSDGQWPAKNLLRMIGQLEKGADLVVGERVNRRSVYSVTRRIISHGFNLLPRLLFGIATRDAGSIKLGRQEIFALPLISRSPFVEAERIITARKSGYRVDFIAIEFLPRATGKALGARPRNVVASIRDCLRLFVRQLRRPIKQTPAKTSSVPLSDTLRS